MARQRQVGPYGEALQVPMADRVQCAGIRYRNPQQHRPSKYPTDLRRKSLVLGYAARPCRRAAGIQDVRNSPSGRQEAISALTCLRTLIRPAKS